MISYMRYKNYDNIHDIITKKKKYDIIHNIIIYIRDMAYIYVYISVRYHI